VRIVEMLTGLALSAEASKAGENVWKCYDTLVAAGIVPRKEMPLVELWLEAF
jgi:hypothetical protein